MMIVEVFQGRGDLSGLRIVTGPPPKGETVTGASYRFLKWLSTHKKELLPLHLQDLVVHYRNHQAVKEQ